MSTFDCVTHPAYFRSSFGGSSKTTLLLFLILSLCYVMQRYTINPFLPPPLLLPFPARHHPTRMWHGLVHVSHFVS